MKGLIFNEEQEMGEIYQIVDFSKDMGGTDDINQSNKSALNKTNQNLYLLGILLVMW